MQQHPVIKTISCLMIWVLIFPVTALAENEIEGNETRIVSLDLCTDWMLLNLVPDSKSVTYSPLLYRYKQARVREGLATHDGSLEQLMQINPDLVITGEFNATQLVKRLKQLGKQVEIMSLPKSLQDIIDYMKAFQAVLPADLKIKKIPAMKQFAAKDKSLLLLGANGIGTGRQTLENDIIEKAGWTNYLHEAGFISLDLEKIVSNPPDAVLTVSPLSNSLANLVASHTVLMKIKKLQKLDSIQSWRWQCPGPWTFELVKELAAKS